MSGRAAAGRARTSEAVLLDEVRASAVREVEKLRTERDEARTLADQLQRALDTRLVIEQAKGVMAERCHVDLDEAFAVLRRFSRDHNLPIHGVCAIVVASATTGALGRAGLPADPPGGAAA